MNRRANIGFDRRIDLEWLDAAAAQAAAGAPTDEMRAYREHRQYSPDPVVATVVP